MDDQGPSSRRAFFRLGLAKLIDQAAELAKPLGEAAKHFSSAMGQADSANPSTPADSSQALWLRPPGAISEKDFLTKCTRCGDCVRACPASAIKVQDGYAGSAPFIDPDTQACVMCDSLACMPACPTGALLPTARFDIDMGTAVWRDEQCLLTEGQDCQKCVDICPMGTAAIERVGMIESPEGKKHGGEIQVHPLACTGCGLCQNACPTTPKAVWVIAKMARER